MTYADEVRHAVAAHYAVAPSDVTVEVFGDFITGARITQNGRTTRLDGRKAEEIYNATEHR